MTRFIADEEAGRDERASPRAMVGGSVAGHPLARVRRRGEVCGVEDVIGVQSGEFRANGRGKRSIMKALSAASGITSGPMTPMQCVHGDTNASH